MDELRAIEPEVGPRLPGVVAVLIATTLCGCAGRPPALKHMSSAEYCAAEKNAFNERLARERDEVPRIPDAAEVARWQRFESMHFVLSTDLGTPLAEHTLRELEDYFAALTSIAFPATPPVAKIPVIALASHEETQRYEQPCYEGVYAADVLLQPAVLLGTGSGGILDHIARYELAQYAMRLVYRRSLPRWFAVGMGTYYDTLAYDATNGQLMFGRAGLGRIHELRDKERLLPLEKLVEGTLDPADNDDVGAYYANCWLFMHALIHEAAPVLDRITKELLAGANGREAWMRATTPQFRGGADAWLSGYYKQRRYEAGRRMRWRPPVEAFERRPMTYADVLTTSALLHAMGAASQNTRAGWHNTRALAAARWALERDPTQLDALQIEWELGAPPSVDRVRPAMQGREQNWVAWMVLARALAHQRSHPPERVLDLERQDAEREDALARAAALNPDDPKVLLARAGDALEFGRWEEARRLYEQGLRFAADEPRFASGYVSAMTRDGRCGAMARDMNEHIKAAGPKRAWIHAAHMLAECRVNATTGADLEANP